MKTLFVITVLFLSICACTSVYAQKTVHAIVVSGTTTSTTPANTLRGSLGQTVIGRPRATNNIQSVGFWYRPRKGGTTVAIPAAEGEIGTRVSIPVMLTYSSGLVTFGPKNYMLKVRYNHTVLVYEGQFPIEKSGDESIITVTGSMADSVGVLADLSFLVTLGNAETTQMSIDTVQWEGSTAKVDRVHGTFQALGVCKAGETTRLILRKATTAIASIAPQPAVDVINVEVLLGQDGPMSLHVINLEGASVANLVYEPNAKAGRFEGTYDVSQLISGSYYLVLQTADQLHTSSLIIRK